jgi:hypothetical protein
MSTMCFASASQVVVRLLHGAHGRDLGQPADRLRLDVDHDPSGDVVDDDRLVARACDRCEVRDDPALRRLVVVRRHDEERVGAELVRLLCQVHRVRGRVRAGAGDNRCVVADRVDCSPEEVETLVVGEIGALPGRPGDDDSVGPVLDEVPCQSLEGVEVNGPVLAERGHDRGQDVAEHLPILRVRHVTPSAQRRPSSSWLRHSPSLFV